MSQEVLTVKVRLLFSFFSLFWMLATLHNPRKLEPWHYLWSSKPHNRTLTRIEGQSSNICSTLTHSVQHLYFEILILTFANSSVSSHFKNCAGVSGLLLRLNVPCTFPNGRAAFSGAELRKHPASRPSRLSKSEPAPPFAHPERPHLVSLSPPGIFQLFAV